MKVSVIVLAGILLAGCAMHYPPAFAPGRGQSAAQHDADARDCDRQVHSVGRNMLMGWANAWTEPERDGYLACMQGRGYVAEKKP